MFSVWLEERPGAVSATIQAQRSVTVFNLSTLNREAADLLLLLRFAELFRAQALMH